MHTVPAPKTPEQSESEKITLTTSTGTSDAGTATGRAPRDRTAAPWRNSQARKVVVAVHGVGDQYSYATIQAVVNQFCGHYGNPPAVPLGGFHGHQPYSMPVPPFAKALKDVAFAEVYWATIPRTVVDDQHTLEESKKWAHTLVERLKLSAASHEEFEKHHVRPPNFSLLQEVLGEMIQTIAVCDRLCTLGEKAGLFTFDLRRLVEDYLGDVQVVAEFADRRRQILDAFSEVLTRVDENCPNAEGIYVIAHSEGTVVALLGMLEAISAPDRPAWTRKLRGFMTLGSPIDKHLALWPELFDQAASVHAPPPVDPKHPRKRIVWHNYYDVGDPIGFSLDDARVWLRARRWQRVFDFPVGTSHDHGFARYAFPGKAHVDYWTDGDVFKHFIDTVIEPTSPAPAPPCDRWWQSVVSYAVPYLGIIALTYVASYVLYKAVTDALVPLPDNLDAIVTAAVARGQSTLAQVVQADTLRQAVGDDTVRGTFRVARHVTGITALVLGTTVSARMRRLVRTPGWTALGLALGAVGCVIFVLCLPPATSFRFPGTALPVSLVTAGLAFALGTLAAFGTWRLRSLIWTGTGVAVVAALLFLYDALHGPANTRELGPLWPVMLAAAGFLYLWWLAALLFDLVFVWHWYIRHSRIADRVREIIRGRPVRTPRAHHFGQHADGRGA